VFKWGTRKEDGRVATPVAEPTGEAAVSSKVLPRVLTALAGRPSPVLLDLGPVVGANVAFFGEHLACKLHVEDLFAYVEAHARTAGPDDGAPDVAARLAHPDGTVDGILCWDLFDYLDTPSSQALAARLTSLLRPGGVIYAFFGMKADATANYTRFVVETDDTMRHRPYAATPTHRHVLTNRDITRMFEGLEVVESVLLKSRTRETLFRKHA
jgi:hypothetical protein